MISPGRSSWAFLFPLKSCDAFSAVLPEGSGIAASGRKRSRLSEITAGIPQASDGGSFFRFKIGLGREEEGGAVELGESTVLILSDPNVPVTGVLGWYFFAL